MKKLFALFLLLFYSIFILSFNNETFSNQNDLEIENEKNLCLEGFIAGTKIKTHDGYKQIEDLVEGDLIVGFDPLEQDYNTTKVIDISKKEITEFVKIYVDNELICAAPHQRFYVLNKPSWIEAENIKQSDVLFKGLTEYCCVQNIEKIYEPIEVYFISVDQENNFFITSNNILVHNSEAALKTAVILLRIGRVVLKHPIIQILGKAADLAEICYELHKNAKKSQALSAITIPEIVAFDEMRSKLFKLRNDFLKIKNSLENIIKANCAYSNSYTNTLLSSIKLSSSVPDSTLFINESKLNDQQKANLSRARQTELDKIKNEIINLQIALAFHFNELIEARNKAVKEYYNIKSKIKESIKIWNANLKKTSYSLAIFQYENIHIKVEDVLNNIENRNKELKFALQYYKNIQNASVLKNTTNISQIIDKEEKEIVEVEKIISFERERNNHHQKVIESYFIRTKINFNVLKQNYQIKFQKQRQSINAKDLAEVVKRGSGIKPPEDSEKNKNGKQIKTLDDILRGAKPGKKTNGRTKQFEKPGGYSNAVEDFNSMEVHNIKNIKHGKMGKLSDGRIINVRIESTDKRPTLEIYNPKNKSSIKIRYGDK